MAAGSTYSQIATNTVSGSSTSTVTFSNISSTYTNLLFIIQFKQSGSTQNFRLRYNSDTATNYSYTNISGSGGAASSGRGTSTSGILFPDGGTTNISNQVAVNLLNYSNTTTYKTALARFDGVERSFTMAYAGLWRSTSAISTVTFDVNSETFTAGSTFTLYGIKGA